MKSHGLMSQLLNSFALLLLKDNPYLTFTA